MIVIAGAEAEETLTEHNALVDLVRWSTSRPRWQQDALRRLILNESLDESDLDDLAAICCDPAAEFTPISSEHLATGEATTEPISLVRIENPKGINALAADQKLEFAKKGLTIVYGDNGSGKSGYVRVLKHACRTRDRGTKIIQDIETAHPVAQSSKLIFARGDTEDFFDWTPQVAGHRDLPAVSIFDSRSANVHVESTNAVAYMPRPMQILEALAACCDQLKSRLEKNISALSAQTPQALKATKLRPDTAAGAFVHGLSCKSNLSQLTLLSNLSEAEKQRLVQLESDLSQDPKRLVARLTSLRSQLAEYVAAINQMALAANGEAFQKRDKLVQNLAEKAAAAKLASEGLFSASPLPEVGAATWRALWEAARKYSDDVAYVGEAFPKLEVAEDRCLLCQRPLDDEVIQRWATFESFVKGSTKAEESAAASELNRFVATSKKSRLATKENHRLNLALKAALENPELASGLKRAAVAAAWRLRAFCRRSQQPKLVVEIPMQKIADCNNALDERIAKLSAAEGSAEHVQVISEFRELKDREGLAIIVDDLKDEIRRLIEIDSIRKVLKETAKNSVTSKNKELSDRLVTSALRGRFAREIEKLKLTRMPVELRKVKDSSAVSYFQVCFVEKPGQPVGEIFSEGEHRCVALAAFLAELVTSRRYSGIVFDDPMSSLDHIHRKSVAARLAEEAVHRQVIVFTHDLTFLFELRREAQAKDVEPFYQTVCRRQTKPGYIDGELPSKAKSAKQLAHGLRQILKAEKGNFNTWNETKRTIMCKGFIEQLREAWDQGIADFIYPVLKRFDNAIAGSTLYKLTVLTEADVETVTSARGRLSEDLHVGAETINPQTVSYDELKAEILKLETWLDDIIARQSAARPPRVSYA